MGPKDQSIDSKSALRHFLTNALVVPGLGTMMMGRWRGGIQLALAVGGVALTGHGVYAIMRPILEGQLEMAGIDWRPMAAGIALFIVGWVWSMVDGWILWRRSLSKNSKVPPKLV